MDKAALELYAGIFPRRAMMGNYSDAFFSDSLRFYDNNIEGILLRISNQKTLWELGCGWMGQFGQVRKEKFMIFFSWPDQCERLLQSGIFSLYVSFCRFTEGKGCGR